MVGALAYLLNEPKSHEIGVSGWTVSEGIKFSRFHERNRLPTFSSFDVHIRSW